MDIKTKPFVLSLSKHERRSDAPFDKLRVSGDSPASPISLTLQTPLFSYMRSRGDFFFLHPFPIS